MSFPSIQTKTGRQLVNIDITRNGETYNWQVYMPLTDGIGAMAFLNAYANIIESDILHKESIWAVSPHTEIIEDPTTGLPVEVPIPKNRIVCATVPDYVEFLTTAFFYDENEALTVLNKFSTTHWHYPLYAKRVKAPTKQLTLNDTGVKVYGWFMLRKLPIIRVGDTTYLYCSSVLPEHQTLIDATGGVVVTETRP